MSAASATVPGHNKLSYRTSPTMETPATTNNRRVKADTEAREQAHSLFPARTAQAEIKSAAAIEAQLPSRLTRRYR